MKLFEARLSGKFYGIPEAREAAIEELTSSLLLSVQKDRPGAFIIAGPQRVGKSSAVLKLEQALREQGLRNGTDYSHVNARSSKFPAVHTLIFDEIPLQETKQLQKTENLLSEGKRIVLDVVNKHYSLGDPRNNTESAQILRSIFPHDLLHLKQLFAVQPEFAIDAKVAGRYGGRVDFGKNPKLVTVWREHQERVKRSTSDGVFVAGETYVNEDGILITPLVWTGKPTYGSIDAQEVASIIDHKLL